MKRKLSKDTMILLSMLELFIPLFAIGLLLQLVSDEASAWYVVGFIVGIGVFTLIKKQADRYNEFDDPTYKGLHRNYMKYGGKKSYNEFVRYLNRIDFVEVEKIDDDLLKDQTTIYFTKSNEEETK